MAVKNYTGIESRGAPESRGGLSATLVAAAFLTKLAKHLALLASLTIVGSANGHSPIGQLTIFLLIVAAALIRLLGRSIQQPRPRPVALRRSGS